MEIVKLGDYVKIKTGKLDANAANTNGRYPFFTCSNEPLKINDYSYNCECVLVAGNGDLNVKYYNGKFDAYQRTYIIEVKNNEVLNTRYIYYLVNNNLEKLRKNAIGGVIKYIKLGNLENIELKLIDIKEQFTIVEKLDKVQEIISIREKQIEELDEIIKSQFVKMFGETGKEVDLVDYVEFQEGPGVRSADFTETGTILLTGTNINNNEITFGHKSDRFISNELANGRYSHFMCDKNDILVVSSAISPEKFDKKVVEVNEDKKYCLNTGIIRFKINKQFLNNVYFREFLKTQYFKSQVVNEMRGIAQMHFGPSHLKRMKILLPESIQEQIEFENIVKQIDKQKIELQKNLEEMEKLQESLVNKYFN